MHGGGRAVFVDDAVLRVDHDVTVQRRQRHRHQTVVVDLPASPVNPSEAVGEQDITGAHVAPHPTPRLVRFGAGQAEALAHRPVGGRVEVLVVTGVGIRQPEPPVGAVAAGRVVQLDQLVAFVDVVAQTRCGAAVAVLQHEDAGLVELVEEGQPFLDDRALDEQTLTDAVPDRRGRVFAGRLVGPRGQRARVVGFQRGRAERVAVGRFVVQPVPGPKIVRSPQFVVVGEPVGAVLLGEPVEFGAVHRPAGAEHGELVTGPRQRGRGLRLEREVGVEPAQQAVPLAPPGRHPLGDRAGLAEDPVGRLADPGLQPAADPVDRLIGQLPVGPATAPVREGLGHLPVHVRDRDGPRLREDDFGLQPLTVEQFRGGALPAGDPVRFVHSGVRAEDAAELRVDAVGQSRSQPGAGRGVGLAQGGAEGLGELGPEPGLGVAPRAGRGVRRVEGAAHRRLARGLHRESACQPGRFLLERAVPRLQRVVRLGRQVPRRLGGTEDLAEPVVQGGVVLAPQLAQAGRRQRLRAHQQVLGQPLARLFIVAPGIGQPRELPLGVRARGLVARAQVEVLEQLTRHLVQLGSGRRGLFPSVLRAVEQASHPFLRLLLEPGARVLVEPRRRLRRQVELERHSGRPGHLVPPRGERALEAAQGSRDGRLAHGLHPE
ncbi:hypothetical protein GCM10025787_02600 [Saccharopolyspora rosea]